MRSGTRLHAAHTRTARRGGARGWGRLPAAEPGPCASRQAGWRRSPGSSTVQREKDVVNHPGGAGGGSPGWPRAQLPARPAWWDRSAPAGALIPILLRKHLLSFKVMREPFRRGEKKPQRHHSALQTARVKTTQKKGLLLEEIPQLPARTALQPSAPRRGGSRIAAPLRPQRFSAPDCATAAPHPAAYPQFLLIITMKITIAITATVIMEIIARIRGSERQVTKQGRRTGESMSCRCAERCAGAENHPEGS